MFLLSGEMFKCTLMPMSWVLGLCYWLADVARRASINSIWHRVYHAWFHHFFLGTIIVFWSKGLFHIDLQTSVILGLEFSSPYLAPKETTILMHYVFGFCKCCGVASADKWHLTIESFNCKISCQRFSMPCRLFYSHLLVWVSIPDLFFHFKK